jgi:murein DD-endopeptidase MepM/ murein hydrolase activator NlpD
MRSVRRAVPGAAAVSAVVCACYVLAPTLVLARVPDATASTTPAHPVVSAMSVPESIAAGRPPRVSMRVVLAGVRVVYVQVSIVANATHTPVVISTPGWVPTNRTLNIAWSANARLAAGTYEVSVSAHDKRGEGLLRSTRYPGVAPLTVKGAAKASSPAPVSAPAPVAPAPGPVPVAVPVPVEAGVPTPEQLAAAGAVFPVAGPHNFGNAENAFGAPRDGYSHQGQDILTAEGTPVVAPLPGTILTTSYQEAGAGYYAVEQTSVGFDFMNAHCEASSLVVSTGQSVSAGQELCKAGETGDATTPHLDFEMWVGGWQSSNGHPINPLPYLEAWEHDGSSG